MWSETAKSLPECKAVLGTTLDFFKNFWKESGVVPRVPLEALSNQSPR